MTEHSYEGCSNISASWRSLQNLWLSRFNTFVTLDVRSNWKYVMGVRLDKIKLIDLKLTGVSPPTLT